MSFSGRCIVGSKKVVDFDGMVGLACFALVWLSLVALRENYNERSRGRLLNPRERWPSRLLQITFHFLFDSHTWTPNQSATQTYYRHIQPGLLDETITNDPAPRSDLYGLDIRW